MVSLYEMFIYSVTGWGEKTPRSAFQIDTIKKWPNMNDSNIFTKDEGIDTYNSSNTSAGKNVKFTAE